MDKERTSEENQRTIWCAFGCAVFGASIGIATGASIGGEIGALIGGILGVWVGEYSNRSERKDAEKKQMSR